MNIKDLTALVQEQTRQLQAVQEAHMHLVQRADNIVEGFKNELAARDERIHILNEAVDRWAQSTVSLTADSGNLHNLIACVEEIYPRIETLEKLVLARNASAATKRNMTNEDALRILTGDLKGFGHKEAAELIGLTYAQVYSCRGEFTFKHVHKDLRDNVKDWKNPWAK